MKNPLVSVIVPVYKVEPFLRECIESILNQSYNNLEIILVDDGGGVEADRSGEICDEYAAKDARIQVIHKPNGGPGPSDARNAGLNICTGTYISFIDPDDVIHPQFIELLYKHIGDADFVLCDYLRIKEKEKPDFALNSELAIEIEEYLAKNLINTYLDFKKTSMWVPWNKLYKRSVWNDLRFPIGMLHEDLYVCHHLISKCEKIRFFNSKLYYYRTRKNSAITNTDKDFMLKKELAHIIIYEDIRAFAEKNNLKVLLNKSVLRRNNHYLLIFEFFDKNKIPPKILDDMKEAHPGFTLKQKIKYTLIKRTRGVLILYRAVRKNGLLKAHV